MWRMSFCYYAFLYLLAAEFLRHRVINCFSAVERQNLHGIWKLQLDPANALNTKDGKNILLKIQEDGSFQQCNDDDRPDDKNWMTGLWAFEDQELKLAMDRKCFSRDVLLSGKVCEGTESGCKFSIQKGVVSAGRFMYPQAHTSFFENPMAAAERAGKFSLKQVFGFSSIPISTEREEKPANKFKTSDFYNRKFFMTFVPIESKGKSRKEVHDELPVDIRAMPIEFLPNGTFVATGTNKILRGRFEITEENMLRFKVSRFGIGRSTPGSVYSEGKGLSHEGKQFDKTFSLQ